MKQAVSRLDKLIIFCRNVQRTSSLYSQALGLKVYLQSDTFVQLRDCNNFSIYLQSSSQPSHLMKGYSPMLSFRVEDIDKTLEKLQKYDIMTEGEPQVSEIGKVFTFMGLDGEMITVNNFQAMDGGDESSHKQKEDSEDLGTDEIKKLLQKIKI